MDRLYFLAKVARGIEAADRGDVVPHAEARRLILGRTTRARPRGDQRRLGPPGPG